MFNDSDEYDFNPANSGKLAALFGIANVSDDTNSSLKYTAPKQPKAKQESDLNESVKNKPQTSVLLAKIVSLWKQEDKDYKALGKHGLAVIGSKELNLYEIIAYKEKNNILLRRKINDTCTVYNKKDCFCTFYDNDTLNWLARFDNFTDQDTFCQTIQSYGAKIIDATEEVPQNDRTPAKTTKEEIAIKTELSTVDSPEKDAEINSDSSGSVKRATILSRMAKMGQQILPSPLLKNTSTDVSDSELDDSKNDRKVHPRKMKRATHTEKSVVTKEEKPVEPPQKNYSESQVLPAQKNYSESQVVPAQNTNYNNFPVQLPQNMPSPVFYSPPMHYDGFSNFLMAQNAELKMNLTQISAKLDNVLSQSNAGGSSTEDGSLKSKVKVLELKMSNLQSELERSEVEYNILEKSYNELREKAKNYSFGKKEDEAVIENLRDDIDRLKTAIKTGEEKLSEQEELRNEVKRCKNTISENEKALEIQRVKLKELEEFYEENKDKKLGATIDSLNETISNLKLRINDLEQYRRGAEEEKRKRVEENSKIVTAFSDRIKKHMNNMYQSILSNFDEGSSYSLPEIRSSIAQNLKGTTFNIIDDLKNVYRDPDVE